MRRIARATGLEEAVASFIASDEWVDLLSVFDTQLITGRSMGLKNLAQLCGFTWTVDDPGGVESMIRYEAAVDPSDPIAALAARAWVTTYNRSDVQAMAALRDWLGTEAVGFASIEGLGG